MISLDIDDNELNESKKEAFNALVEDEKLKSISMKISTKRNTAIDKLIERKCFICNSL